MFRSMGNGETSHERLKLLRKCSYESCSAEKETLRGLNNVSVDIIVRRITKSN